MENIAHPTTTGSKNNNNGPSTGPKLPNRDKLLPMYATQCRKISKLEKENEILTKTIESHNSILIKHEAMLKQFLTLATYETKNQVFMSDVGTAVGAKFSQFNNKLISELRCKVDEDDFTRRMTEKASSEDAAKLILDVMAIKNDIVNIKAVLENKADDTGRISAATTEELLTLQRNKADRIELENLRGELQRIEGIVDQLDGDYSDEDSYDEYDDEDSQVEDVISLGEGASQDKDEGEDDDEEFFEGDDDPAKKLADKAKELTSKNLIAGTGFSPSSKILGDSESKLDQLQASNDTEQTREIRKEEGSGRKKTIDNEDLKTDLHNPVEEKKKEEPEKSAKGTTDIDCAETTNSMGMTMNTNKAGGSRACGIKKQETMRSRRRGLSRMSSKMSISTRRRGGRGGGANSKDVNELKLNMKMVLEDLRRLKNFEHESEGTFRRFENTLVELKKKNDIFISQFNTITKRHEEIENDHANAMQQSEKSTKKVIQIYKDIQKLINDFKSEYRYGFKKIIKAEVDINTLDQQLKFIKTKIKPKKEEKFDKNEFLKQIDGKFELLYGQVAEMATDQADFNFRIQKDQENMKEPLQAEIYKIREEGNIMLRELERTQQTNRDMMNNLSQSMYEPESGKKLNRWMNKDIRVNSTNRKHFNNSYTEAKPSMCQIRHSTPSQRSSCMTNLKRYNFNPKDLRIPNFSKAFQLKKKEKNRTPLQAASDSKYSIPSAFKNLLA